MPHDSTEITLARASLLALRSCVPAHGEWDRNVVVLLPDMRPVPSHMAELYLAESPKRLVCVAWERGGRLVAGTWHISASGIGPELLEMLRSVFREARDCRMPSAATDVLLEGDGESLELTYEECERWLTEYDFPLADFEVVPSEGALATHAACVVRFFASQDNRLST